MDFLCFSVNFLLPQPGDWNDEGVQDRPRRRTKGDNLLRRRFSDARLLNRDAGRIVGRAPGHVSRRRSALAMQQRQLALHAREGLSYEGTINNPCGKKGRKERRGLASLLCPSSVRRLQWEVVESVPSRVRPQARGIRDSEDRRMFERLLIEAGRYYGSNLN